MLAVVAAYEDAAHMRTVGCFASQSQLTSENAGLEQLLLFIVGAMGLVVLVGWRGWG